MNKSQTPKDAASSATETANVEKKTAPASVEKAKVKKTTTKDEKKTPLKTTQQSQSSSTSSPTISAPATVIMTPREEIEARKEAKRREEESNMTFKPKLAVKKSTTKAAAGGDSSPPPTTIFTRLAESKKAVTPTTDTAPTVPKAKATPESINRLYAGASSKNKTTSVYDTIEDASTAPKAKKVSAEEAAASVQRLYAQADKLKERLEAVKIKTESEAKSECTFKPTLHSKPPTTGAAGAKVGGGDSTSAAATAGADYTQRLSIYAAEKAKKLEEARRQREKAELEECSFKPALHLSAGTKSHGILNGDGANASASTTGTSYRKVIAPEECTFKPQLVTSRHSPTGPARTAGGVSVHERLFKAGVTALKEQEEQRRRAKEEEIEKTCTFAPQMDCTSHHHSLHTNASGSATEVFERLARAKKEDLSPIKEKLELSECTFHPQVPELAGASSK